METTPGVLNLNIDQSEGMPTPPHLSDLVDDFEDEGLGEQTHERADITTRTKTTSATGSSLETVGENRKSELKSPDYKSRKNCNGTPIIPDNPLLDTDGVTCGECMEKFTNLQKYMEHSCSGSLSGATKQHDDFTYENNDDDGELSDIENFEGKIVYQPDGSAYLIENVGDSDEELLPNLPDVFDGTNHPFNSKSNQLTVQPPIVNSLHIPCTTAYMNMNMTHEYGMSLPGITSAPVMQSYRVYDVRTQKNKKAGEGDKDENEQSNKEFIFENSKPILMCFLCKLSFGFAKSFVGHAVNEHKLVLNEKEKTIMSRKNQSAIIQGLGKEKEALLSFLEPQAVKSQATSGSNFNTNGQAYYQQMLGTTQPSVSYIYPVSVPVSTNNSLVTTSTAQHEGQSPIVAVKTKEQGYSSNSDGPEDTMEPAIGKQCDLPKNISVEESKKNPSTSNESDQAMDIAASENNNKGAQSSPKENKAESPVHFRKSPVLNTSKQQNGCATSQAPEVLKASSPTTAKSELLLSHPDPSNKVEGDGKNSTYIHEDSTARDEKEATYKGTSPCKHDYPEEPNDVYSHYNADGKISSSVECPKCDMVLGSSRSLGGHMTMMHSRNSCKTLKCPKCNWHYKYQQTLEAHMKEKHPESETKCVYCQTNQPHPRLARGETYTCGYKPFRCEICNYSTTTKGNLSIHMQSDKHLNNFQELQSGGAVVAAANAVTGTSSGEHMLAQSKMSDPSTTKQKPKPTWRCDVCEYETNVARNLRIHMTSEKHMHNMLAVQHNMTQMQHDLQMNLGNYQHDDSMYRLMTQNMVPISIATEAHLDPHAMMAEYPYDQAMYAAAIAGQLTPEMMEMEAMGDDQPPVNEDPTKNEPLKMFQCSVCNKFVSDDLDELYDHIHQDRSMPTDSSWKIQIADVIRCNLCSYSTQLKANFQLHCKTDKHIQKLQLVNHIKEGGNQNEWRLKYMNVSNPTQVKCNACDYYTYSVEKLKAHVANYRHETSLKLFRHLQDIKITINSETKYYHCNMCNYTSKAKLSLIQHVRSMKHLRMEEEYLRRKADMNTDEEDSPINEGVLDLSKKDRSFSESGAEEMRAERSAHASHAEQTSKKSTVSSSEASSSSSSTSVMRTTTTQIYTCPYCKYSSIDQDRIRAHVLSQHSVKPQAVLRCPLCQDMCTNKINLEIHLVQVHSVSRECIQRLLSTVERSEWIGGSSASSNPPSASPTSLMSPGVSHLDSPTNQTSQSPSSNMFSTKVEEASEGNQGSDVESGDQYRCQKCHQVFQNLDGLYKHQNEVCPLKEQETPGGPGFLCWKKGCNQYFKTSAALQMHFKEIHAKRPQLPVSDRHVYKYRCNQCSLAFKTMEKLQIHSQYHMIRAATKCGTCDRSFRSIAALRKHMETSHMETPNSDMAQYFGMTNNTGGFLGIPTTSTPEAAVAVVNSMGIPVSATASGMFSQTTGGDSSMQAVTPDVLDEKSQDSMSSDLYSELQEDSNQAMDLSSEQDGDGETNLDEEGVQDSMHISEETYHDPIRKYKCHRCKVGFTKQSELSNHHRTLQHRSGCRAAYTMDKYLDPNRPYKCDTCKESFTQKNILLVHYNSVSHLHKLKRSQNETEASPPDTSPSNDKKPFKCNICKVAYSQGSTLDIHMRSVLHQTRAAKLESAGAFGGLQHIGQQSDASSAYTATLTQDQKQQSVHLQHQLMAAAAAEATQQLAHLQAQQGSEAASAAAANAITSAALTQQLMDPTSLAFFQQQLLSTGMSSGMYTCGRCNSFFMTQDALAQHQTLCGMNDAATAAQFASQQKTYMTYTPRPTYPMMRSFLENYGFDLVQQFNESAQGLPPNIDPKDKFKCDQCNKEFSSVWVFKAHAEQDHKSFFPTDKIHQFSEVYRDEYDKLQNERSGVLTSNVPSPGTPATPTESTSAQASATEQTPGASQMEMLQSTSPAVATCSASAMPPPAVPSPAVVSCTASAMPPPAIPSPSTQMILPSAIPIPLQPMQTISYIDPSAYMQKSPKRARTRITDEQLKILRAHFDINNSPSEDQICEMSEKSGLPHKVIKHWFRNTLFKERQRNKDSPYNFNNPPSTNLPMSSETQTSATVTTTEKKADTETMISESSVSPVRSEVVDPVSTPTTSLAEDACATPEPSAIQPSSETPPVTTGTTNTTTIASAISDTAFVSSAAAIPISSTPSNLIPPHSVSPPLPQSSQAACTYSNSLHSQSSSKRAGRTRFTDYQIKMLQEFFENNAYPKDDDLEHLSKLLGLSPRVIVVWFQNARQKARKMFENQPPPETDAESGGARYRRTPGLNYQCNKCLLVFQRFFELIKHQKQHCYKEDDCSTTSYAGSSTPTSPNTPTSIQTEPAVSVKSEEKKSESSKSSEVLSTPQVHYQCDKCDLVFPQFDQWNEHQQVHFMQSFRSYMPQHNPFNMMYMPFDASMNGLTAEQYFSAFQPTKGEVSSGKRKLSETDDTASETHSAADQDQPRDKRLRTTISPQQLEILYQKYQEDSNPTRRMLDMIARQVGLKKRVVQVWFQNTRARERKGQFRLSAPNHLHKRCPFCRAIFKAKTALEAHIKARHWDQLVNGNALDSLLKQSDAFSYGELGEGTSTAMSPRMYEDFTKTGSTSEDGDLKGSSFSSPTSKGGDKPSSARTGSEDCIIISDSQDDDSQDIEDGHKDTGSNGDGVRDDIESMTSSAADTGCSNMDDRAMEEGESMRDGDSNEGDFDNDSLYYSETTSNTQGGEEPSSLSDKGDENEQRRQARELGKRFRTQMSQLQLKVLKCCFADYRTPTMHECELLGNEIGLPKRVVQVWFQNARAKDKKSKQTYTKHFGLIGSSFEGGQDTCKLCGVQYSAKLSVRDHVFTEIHIHNVKKHINGQLEKDTTDSSSSVSQLLQHASPIEAQRAMAASFLPNHQAALLGHGHLGTLQSMQAHAMSAFLGQVASPPEAETSKKEETTVKKEAKESAESSTSGNNSEDAAALAAAAAAAAASQASYLPSMSGAEAAYMPYFFGGMSPYYTQTPFVYPLYSPEQAAAFFPYDPSIQMGLQAHLLQAQHMSPHHSAVAGFSPSVGESTKHPYGSSSSSSSKESREAMLKSTSTSSTTQESRHSRSEDKHSSSSSHTSRSSASHPSEASTSDHSTKPADRGAARKSSSASTEKTS